MEVARCDKNQIKGNKRRKVINMSLYNLIYLKRTQYNKKKIKNKANLTTEKRGIVYHISDFVKHFLCRLLKCILLLVFD